MDIEAIQNLDSVCDGSCGRWHCDICYSQDDISWYTEPTSWPWETPFVFRMLPINPQK
jgi:hypothetical protein